MKKRVGFVILILMLAFSVYAQIDTAKSSVVKKKSYYSKGFAKRGRRVSSKKAKVKPFSKSRGAIYSKNTFIQNNVRKFDKSESSFQKKADAKRKVKSRVNYQVK